MLNSVAHIGSNNRQRMEEYKELKPTPQDVNRMVRQVGHKVLDFSSQYSSNKSRSYAASNLAGPARSYPDYGDFQYSFVLVN
jgi:hypothetical protein